MKRLSGKKATYEAHETEWRSKIFHIIFGMETKMGRLFDVVLVYVIVISVFVVMLDSVKLIRADYHTALLILEWIFTIFFTLEYTLRILSLKHPIRYIFSFYGIVDIVSIIPTYFSFFFTGSESLLIIRTIRLLRIFRVFKLRQYLAEGEILMNAIRRSKNKVFVFIFAVLSLASIMGALMYLVEGDESGFTSIPRGVYWAVVTMTTVGYGDIAPKSVLGQILAGILMIMGYGIIAVPTGIFSSELAKNGGIQEKNNSQKFCQGCGENIHEADADYCRICGSILSVKQSAKKRSKKKTTPPARSRRK